MAVIICLPLLRQAMPCALPLAWDKTGSSKAARIAMMAMTTSSSMRVKARRLGARPTDTRAFRWPVSFIVICLMSTNLFHDQHLHGLVAGLQFEPQVVEYFFRGFLIRPAGSAPAHLD